MRRDGSGAPRVAPVQWQLEGDLVASVRRHEVAQSQPAGRRSERGLDRGLQLLPTHRVEDEPAHDHPLVVPAEGERPLLGRLLEVDEEASDGVPGLLAAGVGQPALAGPDGGYPRLPGDPATVVATRGEEDGRPGKNVAHEIDQMIDLNQVEGRVRASSVKKIAEIIEKHPEEAVGIIRGWLHSEV